MESKYMKSYINYIKESKVDDLRSLLMQEKYEKIFLELSDLDELKIKFSLDGTSNILFYFYKDDYLFYLDD